MTADRPEDMIEVLREALTKIVYYSRSWFDATSIGWKALDETGLLHVDEDQEGAER